MKKLLIIFKILVLLITISVSTIALAAASYTNVTITLTDGTGQVWAGATWRSQFNQPFGNPHTPTNGGVAILVPQTGTADGTGTFTVTLDDNLVVTPSGSTTTFTLCPNASVVVCSFYTVAVTGASENLSAAASAAITNVTVGARPVIYRAYKDSEVSGGYGSQYINVTDNTLRVCSLVICSGSGWLVSSPTTVNPVFTGIVTVGQEIDFTGGTITGTDRLIAPAGGPFTWNLPASSGTFMDGLVTTTCGSFNTTTGILTLSTCAPLASPVFTGDPQGPTPSTGDNDTSLATTAFVKNQNYITAASAPVTSVFGRTGAVIATSGDYSVGQVTGAAPLASPVFTGDPQAPTPSSGDNDTSIATTAFVTTKTPKILNATGPFSCSGDQTVCAFTLTWPTTFGDTNYTAICDPTDPSETSGSSSLANGGHGVLTATTIDVYAVSSGSASKSYGKWTCYGIHN